MLGVSLSLLSSTWARVLFLQNNSKIHVRVFCMPLGRNLHSCFIVELLFLTPCLFFPHSLTSLINNCLNLLFGTQEKPGRLKPFSTNKQGTNGRTFVPRKSPWGPARFSPPSSSVNFSVLRGTGQDRDGNRVLDRGVDDKLCRGA